MFYEASDVLITELLIPKGSSQMTTFEPHTLEPCAERLDVLFTIRLTQLKTLPSYERRDILRKRLRLGRKLGVVYKHGDDEAILPCQRRPDLRAHPVVIVIEAAASEPILDAQPVLANQNDKDGSPLQVVLDLR